jgi:hypothetical protein
MDELLSLLQVVEFSQVSRETWLEVVQAALDGCPPEDPRYPWLVEIEEALLAGGVPTDGLQDFATRFPFSVRSDAERLEAEFLALAEQLSEAEWQTSQFKELVEALEGLEEDALMAYLEQRQREVCAAALGYSQSPVTQAEVTAETWVGHLLLSQGLEAWQRALELLFHDPETNWETALGEAEWGTRLLVAVQRLNRRVSSCQNLEKRQQDGNKNLL